MFRNFMRSHECVRHKLALGAGGIGDGDDVDAE